MDTLDAPWTRADRAESSPDWSGADAISDKTCPARTFSRPETRVTSPVTPEASSVTPEVSSDTPETSSDTPEVSPVTRELSSV